MSQDQGLLNGSVFGFALSAAIAMLVGYVIGVGGPQLGGAVSERVHELRTAFDAARDRTATRMLLGAAASLAIVALVLSRTASIAIAALLAVAILVRLERTIEIDDARLYLVGGALGCLVGALLDGGVRFGLVIAAVVGAIVLARRGGTPDGTALVVLALLALTPLVSPPPARAAQKTFKVSAKQIAFKAVDVKLTDRYELTITAKGKVTFLRGDAGATAGPDGSPAQYGGCELPGFCGALIGRMGDRGEPFVVGASHTLLITADQPGPLQLAINDFDSSDNTGSFEVTVEVARPKPVAPTTTPTFAPQTSAPASSGGETPGPSVADRSAAALFAAMGAALGRGAGRGMARLDEQPSDEPEQLDT